MARRTDAPGEPRDTYSMRLGDDERAVMEAAARKNKIPLAAFIRQSTMAAARRELAGDDQD